MQSIELTSVSLPGWRDILKWLRANLEWLGTLAALAVLGFFRFEVSNAFASKSWDLAAFYSAAFDWSSIQAAFLFGVYAFFLSRSEPFIQAIAGSPAFRLLRRYVVRTLYLSMALSVITLPMVVRPLDMTANVIDWPFLYFAVTASLFVYTFLCFIKVIRVFGKIERRS